MAKIELRNPGDEAVLAIAAVTVLAGDKGNMVHFETLDGDELAISESAVVRQLDFCKAETVHDIAGKTIHFSRAANKNPKYSPYWNLTLATESATKKTNGKPPVASAPKTVPGGEEETGAPPEDAKADLFAAHGKCFKHVCDKYVPYAAEKGVELSLEGVSALTAQLWIELCKKGLV